MLVGGDVVASKERVGALRWLVRHVVGEAGFPDEAAAVAAVRARLTERAAS